MIIENKAYHLFYKWCEIKNKVKIIKFLEEHNVEVYGGDSSITINAVYLYDNIPSYVYSALKQFEKTDYKMFIQLLKSLEDYV